ncbi:hypothetical protein PENTCL1PPCAC_13698, partial [Pristionchus entomophagus]
SSPDPPVSIYYANARSIRCKSPQLSFLLSSSLYRVICISETWLNPSDSDSFLVCGYPEYFPFRCDRIMTEDYGRGGGVACLVHNSLSPVHISSFSSVLIESCIAFPCVILGDFNFPSIDWTTLSSPVHSDLLDFISDNHFTQYVTFPSRLHNYLDLVFSNKDVIRNVSPSTPLSDHLSVIFNLYIPLPPPKQYVPSRLYKFADWNSINSVIFTHDWTLALSGLDVHQAYEYFVSFISNILDSFVPLSKPSPFSRYPKSLKILYSKSKNLTRIAPNSYASSKMTDRFNTALNRFHCTLENRIVNSSNPKLFYKYCNSKLTAPKTTPSGIIDSDGTLLLTNNLKCIAFDRFFCSVFTHPQSSPLPQPCPSIIFDVPFVSHLDIIYALSKLAPKTKCHIMHYGLHNPRRRFTINDVVLTEPSKCIIKDLGVHFSPSLSFSFHISKIISTARSKANLLFKSFRSNCPDLYLKSFTTFILPNIEYCSIIWNPVHSVDMTRELERVQRDFTRRLYYRCSLPPVSYKSRLRDLNLSTLERRRLIMDITFLQSIVNNRYSMDVSSLFTCTPLTRTLRNCHNFRISLPFIPHNSSSTLASRTISIWNSLPPEIVNTSHNVFRNYIRSQPPSFYPNSIIGNWLDL